MTSHRLVGAYRLTTRLYPRSFRDEFGDDLVQLFADQLDDEAAPRVVARTIVDLLLSVPQRHLESAMHLTRSSALPAFFVILAASALVVGLVVGHPIVLVACALVALPSAVLAILSVRRSRPLAELPTLSSRWAVLLAVGAVLLAGLVVTTNLTGELPEGAWLIAMIIGLTALVLVGAGLVLGVVRLAGRSPRPPLAP